MKKLEPVFHTQDSATPDYTRSLETDVLARTLWGEARGEGVPGMQAVAAVVLNRVAVARDHGRFWWGNSVIQVCQKAYQFSCWNKGDPNFLKLQSVGVDNPDFASAMRIAARAVIGRVDDPTHGATHYHAKGIMPAWAKGVTPTATIGRHIFYRIV